MNMRLLVAAANTGVLFLLGAGIAAEAAEVRVLGSYGMRAVMVDVRPIFEQATGHTIAIQFAAPREIEKRIQDRQTADVVIGGGVDFRKGKVVAESITPVARGLLGIVVRKGAPKPEIGSPDALKRVLLAAKSISHDDGPSNIHFVSMLGRWGIAEEMKRKTIKAGPPPRRVGDLVARGEAEIGIHLIALLTGIPDIEIIGPLPGEIQQTGDVTSAAIMASATDMSAAKALIDFLRTPEAVAVIKASGMAPVKP